MYIHVLLLLLFAATAAIEFHVRRTKSDSTDPTEDSVECTHGKIGNDTAYICERFVEKNQIGQFGIRFLGNRGEFYCGDFREGAPHGKGYEVIYSENDDDYVEVCGNFNDGIREGYGSSYFYNGNSRRQGSYSDGHAEGRFLIYWVETGQIATAWYENAACKSMVGYGQKGIETLRDEHECPLFDN